VRIGGEIGGAGEADLHEEVAVIDHDEGEVVDSRH
jgi:hypothetical protein